MLVVGAVSRDALHAAAGHTSPLRTTDDLDIAVAVSGWDHFNALTAQLRAVTGANSTIRYRVAGHTVDIVPFGNPVESPDGVVSPRRRRGEPMSVFGFQDVWENAYELEVPAPQPVRLPTIPGYTVLKLKAWADRSAYHEYKDGGDLAIAMYWYQEASELLEQRIWGDDAGIALMSDSDFSLPEAAVRLLMGDARALLSPARRDELAAVWRDVVADDILADHLHNALLPGWPPRGDGRLTDYARAIRQTLASVQPS